MKFSKATICISGFLGASLLTLPTIFAGMQMEIYDPITDLIGHGMSDELLYSHILRYSFQVPAGIFLVFYFRTVAQLFSKEILIQFPFRGLSYFLGVAIILNAVFPCDAGCADLTFGLSVSQGLHLMVEGLTYFFIPLMLVFLGLGFRRVNAVFLSKFTNWTSLLIIILVAILYYDQNYAGLLQRILKSTFIAFTFVITYVIYTTNSFIPKRTKFN